MSRVVLSPAQLDFYRNPTDFTLFCGGLGSGKTHVGAFWAITMALKYPGVNGLITANSYSQLKKATLAKLFMLLQEMNIPYNYRSQDGVVTIGKTDIYCLSMEKYDLLRGIEVGWAWSDECAFYREEAFDVMIARIRDTRGPCVWKGTTTPNGFNWLYVRFAESPIPGAYVVRAKTADNIANLRDGYVEILRSQYDSRLAEQELDGQFVNLSSGKVYYGFDRRIHVKLVPDQPTNIYMGLDFNVHPLCGVFVSFDGHQIKIFDELYLEDSNTFKAAKEIISRYPFQRVTVVSDDSGAKRSTKGDKTDREILRRSNLEVVNFRNPSVKDRYNNVNRLLENGLLVVDPKCKKLIEDLEKMVYDNNDPLLSHISDALGYVCWELMPMKKPRRAGSVHYI